MVPSKNNLNMTPLERIGLVKTLFRNVEQIIDAKLEIIELMKERAELNKALEERDQHKQELLDQISELNKQNK